MSDINVYGASWCGDCKRAKEDGAADKAVEISGQKHIPVVQYADGSFQVEPSANDIKAKLQELGALPAEA